MPEDSPHVPVGPEEIAEQVLDCADLGISSVHLHARGPTAEPAWQRDIFADIISRIRVERPDLVICVTTSGRVETAVDKRSDVLQLEGAVKPDMASLTLSSMNFAASASINAPDTVKELAGIMRDRSVVPELEIFDTGMVNYLRYLASKDLVGPPYVVNFILGGIATAQATPLDLGHLVERLPADSLWSVGGIGRAQLPSTAMSLGAGGGVRVGLEDNLYFDSARTRLATNRELVTRVLEIGAALGRRPMTPAELRTRIGR